MSNIFETIEEGKVYDYDSLGKELRSSQKPESILHIAFSFWERGSTSWDVETSGSTGQPKQINFSKEQIGSAAQKSIELFKIKADEIILVCLPLERIGGIMQLFRAFRAASRIAFIRPSRSPFTRIFCQFKQLEFQHTSIVPAQFNDLMGYYNLSRINKSDKGERIRSILIGGAPVSPEIEEQVRKRKFPCWETYGMTETASHFGIRRIGVEKPNVFTLLKGTEIRVDADSNLEVNVDYLGGDWLKTNDRVDIIEPDKFKWHGRSDFVINSGGFKVHPEQIEAMIRKLDLPELRGKNFLISGSKDQDFGERPAMILETKESVEKIEDNLLFELKRHLPKYLNPTKILKKDKLPRTSGGKIDRNSLMEDLGLP